MPPILTDPYILAVVVLGLIGAASTVAGVFLLAVRWRSRSGLPYCLSALVFYALLYMATFEHGLINAKIDPAIAGTALLTILIVGQALVTAVGTAIVTLLLFGGYLALLGPLEFPVNRTKAYAGCALFCFVFAIALNPIKAVRKDEDPANRSIYVQAMARPSPEVVETASQEARRTLDALREIGALTRIDTTDTAVIHHVRGQFLDLPSEVVEEYMQAALFYHVHVGGGRPKPVVLRVTNSGREIATLQPNGRFRRSRASAPQLGNLPPGG
jgi:hypothetical protein